jgi:hypothetical protein
MNKAVLAALVAAMAQDQVRGGQGPGNRGEAAAPAAAVWPRVDFRCEARLRERPAPSCLTIRLPRERKALAAGEPLISRLA